MNPVLDPGFVAVLNQILKVIPLSITRWISTPSHNLEVGGAANSAHLDGLGVDLVADSTIDLIKAAAKAHSLGFIGIELDFRNHHLHLDMKQRQGQFWHVAYLKDGREVSLAEGMKVSIV